MSKNRIQMAGLLVIVLLLVPTLFGSLADDNERQLFRMFTSVTSNAGNHGYSSTQWLRATLSQPQPIGRSSSNNFSLEAGFWPTLSGQSVSAVEDLPPAKHCLKQIYPNPFNPSTTIGFAVAEPSQVSLIIYDLKGRKVRTLVQEGYSVGWFETVWNGRDDRGQTIGSGVYFCRLSIGKFKEVKKITLLQ